MSRPRVVVLSWVSREEKAGIFAGGTPVTLNSLYAPSPLLPDCPVVVYLRQGQSSYLSLDSSSCHGIVGIVTRRP